MAGNAAAVLEGIARLLWNTDLGTPGELVCVQNGHGGIGCHILLLKGRAALPDCLGLPVEFGEVPTLGSVPVL